MGRLRMIGVYFLVIAAAVAVKVAGAEEKTPPSMPVTVVEQTEYTFPEALEGAEVGHDFVIRNTGDAPLIIERVNACKCTTVEFTRSIPAGGEGTVTINLNTSGYWGETVSKTARAHTNDPRNRVIDLTITVPVETFADITPSPQVNFSGPTGTVLKQQVQVIPKKERPFKIIGSKARYGQCVRFEVKETMDDAGRPGYLIDIENTRAAAGNYRDDILLETDSSIKSELEIQVNGNIYAPAP